MPRCPDLSRGARCAGRDAGASGRARVGDRASGGRRRVRIGRCGSGVRCAGASRGRLGLRRPEARTDRPRGAMSCPLRRPTRRGSRGPCPRSAEHGRTSRARRARCRRSARNGHCDCRARAPSRTSATSVHASRRDRYGRHETPRSSNVAPPRANSANSTMARTAGNAANRWAGRSNTHPAAHTFARTIAAPSRDIRCARSVGTSLVHGPARRHVPSTGGTVSAGVSGRVSGSGGNAPTNRVGCAVP